MRTIYLLLICCISLTSHGQIDSAGRRQQLYEKLNKSANYNKLSEYYCSDLVIDGGCTVQPYIITEKKISLRIDFESGRTVNHSYTFTLTYKSKRLEVYDNLSKKKVRNWDKAPKHNKTNSR
jgi:hypothetical protein